MRRKNFLICSTYFLGQYPFQFFWHTVPLKFQAVIKVIISFCSLLILSACIFGEYEGNISAIIHGNMRRILSIFGECAKNILMYSPFTKKDVNLSLSRQIFDQTTIFNHLYRQYWTGRKTLSLYFPYKSYVIILTLKDDVSASASALPSAGQRKSWL